MTNPLHSAVCPNWMTPDEWLDDARAIMGEITLDPASDVKAASRVGARKHYTPAENGLEQPWEGSVFLNAPGRVWKKFLLKAHNEFNEGRVTQLFYLAFSLEQARALEPSEWAFEGKDVVLAIPHKRIRFLDPNTGLKGKSPVAANAILMVLNPERTPVARLRLGPKCNLWAPM